MNLKEELNKTIRTVPNFPKEGIMFKDITPILKRTDLWDPIINAIIDDFSGIKIDGVAGMESRGFLFGPLLAKKLNVPFTLIRKKGKLPAETIAYSYDLEYGSATMEIHKDAFKPGSNILIHDDLLATGGTAIAAAELIKGIEGEIAGFSFLVDLEFLDGQAKLTKYSKNISTLVGY